MSGPRKVTAPQQSTAAPADHIFQIMPDEAGKLKRKRLKTVLVFISVMCLLLRFLIFESCMTWMRDILKFKLLFEFCFFHVSFFL